MSQRGIGRQRTYVRVVVSGLDITSRWVYVPVVTLKELRQSRDFTVARAAEELGLSERHLYRLERGDSPLQRTVAVAMSAVYRVPVDKVLAAAAQEGDAK